MNLDKIKTFEDLKKAKADFFGPNSELKKLQAKIRLAPKEEKNVLGKKINDLKNKTEKLFKEKAIEIENNLIEEIISNEWEDVETNNKEKGSLSFLTLVIKRFKEWFFQNGYYEVEGSEIENNEFNFQRLNIPEDHPARAMHDSLYLNKKTLLRTHNTGFTARELKKNANSSFAQFAIGSVYRNDEDDQTHSHQFKQADLVAVGNYSFPNLIWTLKNLLSYVLEEDVEIRMRPSFFPFTEPSVEVDVFYKSQWIEILGAGMLHKNVLTMAGYTNDMNGFAAGIGIERVTMIKYGINNIREFYKNDARFLKQARGAK